MYEEQKFDDIDVTYDDMNVQNSKINEQSQSYNIADERVKDRWSRYIGAMGIEAVAKQAESRVLLIGFGPLGVEIAKNLVLAGCKELLLFDTKVATMFDVSGGQFFMS